MIEERWFSYPIWYTSTQYKFHDELLKYCLLRKAYDDGNIKSNRGGWQSSDLHSKTDEVISNFCLFLQPYLDFVGKKYKKKFSILNLWININGYNTLNETHTHPGSYISGVFYVRGGDKQGDICFENPLKYINQYIYGVPSFFEFDINYKPETGKLLLFPSSLPHSVLPNETNIDRISIAFNASVISE